MSYTTQRFLAVMLPVSAFALCFAMAARAQTVENLPINRPVQVDGVQAACTGIGDGAEQNPAWQTYPVKLETVGGYGQWLADENVTVNGRDQTVAVHCDAPWVLMSLQPGRYDATVSIPNAEPKHVRFVVPEEGQRQIIVRFRGRMAGAPQPGTNGANYGGQ